MKRRKTFGSKLMLLFSFSLLIPLIITVVFGFNYLNNALAKQSVNTFKDTLNSVASNIDTYLDDLQRLTLSPYMYNEIFEYMEYLNNNKESNNLGNLKLYSLGENYSSILNKLINSSRKDVLAITFIPISNPSKSYLVSKYYDTLSLTESPVYYNDWINKAIEKDGDIFFAPVHNMKYNKSQDEYKVFSLMRVVKNLDKNKVIGIIKVDAREFILKNIISNIKLSNNSHILLLDEYKQIIYSTYPNITSKEVQKAYNSRHNTFDAPNYNILQKSISSNDWQLIYLNSKKDLQSKTILILSTFTFFALLFYIVSMVLFNIKAKKIVNSLYEITTTMEKLESGDLTVKANIDDNYDFEFISKLINNISNKINLHVQSEYRAILNQKKAEYIALQTQINPHFLNNILSGFIALNRLNEKKLLEDSLIQLSEFYRYTCKNSNESTLEEEFKCVEKYLLLEKLRFDDMVEFNLDMGDDTKNIKLPKLILQPLVENCIKHGFKDREEPILINICSKLETIEDNSTLIITITDNGSGFDVNKSISNSSTGVKNIIERMHIFEATSEVDIHSIPNVCTTCIIRLPLKGGNDDEYINC